MKHLHDMPFGARALPDGSAVFRLWAPSAQRIDLVLGERGDARRMTAAADGWHVLALDEARSGCRYGFRINGGDLVVPDPASRSNPDDVHGLSELTDPLAFDWPDDGWKGRPWHEAVIYELHVGCFSPRGTFVGAIDKLDELVRLGVTAIELMPVADFPGRRGWGYDGVLPFAPDASYGAPDDLKRLVVAAHARGLMVFMDVVYNHFGPDGNYLHAYAKPFFNEAVHTPWGAAMNFDATQSRTVRDFFIHNALYWIEEFQLDGLRCDAVHAMRDSSTPHFIDELCRAVRAGPGAGREVHVILENDVNDAARLARDEAGRPLLANAQWNDDVHHALHVLVTRETDGYYLDFAAEPQRLLGRALAEGFAYQGERAPCRDDQPHGTPSKHLPPLAFVNATQTHDQVGNRAFGERIAQLAAHTGHEDALRAAVACVLLAPAPPMLFMGEEWAASTPFLYFCDFSGELAQAVTQGRRAEFGRFKRFSDPEVRDRIPDPNAQQTFLDSKLDWSERTRQPHAAMLSLYTELLAIRRTRLVPWLDGARSGEFTLSDAGTLRIEWPLAQGRRWHLLAQLADDAAPLAADTQPPGETIYRSHGADQGDTLAPWSVQVTIEGDRNA